MSIDRKSGRPAWRAASMLLALAGLGMLAVGVRGHEDQGGPKVKEVRRQPLKEKLDGQSTRVTLVEVEYPPGGGGKPHRHPGPVIGYVLQGAIEIQIDEGPIKTYRQGETFYEPARALHKVSRNASRTEPARLLAYMLTREDETQLVLPPD
jgi:quercetin dioxygenase-like cupin family protein